MTHNCPKLEKYLFLGIAGCFLDPAMGGPSESSCQEGSEYVWQRGVGSQKCLVRGNFQSVPCYRKRADQKPPLTRHFWLPTPLCHTYSEPPFLCNSFSWSTIKVKVCKVCKEAFHCLSGGQGCTTTWLDRSSWCQRPEFDRTLLGPIFQGRVLITGLPIKRLGSNVESHRQ